MAKNNDTTQQVGNADELEQLKALLAEKDKQVAEAEARAVSAEKQAAEAEAQLSAIAEEEVKANEPAPQKMVKIRLPKIRKDEADLFVSVNDYTCIVKRGVEVEVPDFVAEVLRHREEMLEYIVLTSEAKK